MGGFFDVDFKAPNTRLKFNQMFTLYHSHRIDVPGSLAI
jgi:hypothetical protein